MSFDLYVFDLDDVPQDEAALAELMEGSDGENAPPTPRLAAFVAQLERRHPGGGDSADSPWASWPPGETLLDGRCASFNIVWPHADRLRREFRSLCNEALLTLYDPQEGLVLPPDGG